MPEKLDLISMGDLMIDFSCIGKSRAGQLIFERNPGGAPMNVASQLKKLGGTAGIISCVGKDEHGEYLYDLVREVLEFDVTNLQYTEKVGTRFLFAYFDENNDRMFTNYKGSRSDLMIREEEIDKNQLECCKVFNYTPLAFEYDYPIAEAAQSSLETAKAHGALTAFDANYRFPYENKKMFEAVQMAILDAQILKLTLEEMRYFLREENIFRAAERLLANRAKIVAFTMGAGGCMLCTQCGCFYQPTYDVAVVDTTGAGDSFMGALVYSLTRKETDIDQLSAEQVIQIADFCNACSSASTMQRGSLLVMPDLQKVQQIMRSVPKKQMVLEQAIAQMNR